jgi:glycosyltransferase involved in cell wall biosynthesis
MRMRSSDSSNDNEPATDVSVTEIEQRAENKVASAATSARASRGRGRRPRLLIVGPLPPPFIGPAVATERLLASPVLREELDLSFLDTSDRHGFEGIGQLNRHNVTLALSHAWGCLKLLVHERPDAIYVPIARGFWGFLRDLVFLVPSRLLGARPIVHLRAGRFDIVHDNGAPGRIVARLGLACAARGIVLGESVRGVFGGFIRDRDIRVIPNGLELDGWDAAAWSEPRERDSTFRIAYVSNLYEDKGIHVMIEALATIRQRVPMVQATFAGDWLDLGYRDRCLALVEHLGLDDVVHFAGRVDLAGKQALFARAHLAVFVPVKPEGLPWVVLEAMAAGLPVIGTAQGTMAEVIVDGETGIIVPTGDSDALARTVIEIAHTPDLRRALGAAGRRRIEERYSEDRTHRMLVAAVLEVVG